MTMEINNINRWTESNRIEQNVEVSNIVQSLTTLTTQCLKKVALRRKNKKEVHFHVYKDQQLKILHTEHKNCKQFLLRQTDKQNQLQHGF